MLLFDQCWVLWMVTYCNTPLSYQQQATSYRVASHDRTFLFFFFLFFFFFEQHKLLMFWIENAAWKKSFYATYSGHFWILKWELISQFSFVYSMWFSLQMADKNIRWYITLNSLFENTFNEHCNRVKTLCRIPHI